jgi:hypothetical protein
MMSVGLNAAMVFMLDSSGKLNPYTLRETGTVLITEPFS